MKTTQELNILGNLVQEKKISKYAGSATQKK